MSKPLIYVALSQGVLHELEFASYLPQLQALADVQIWDGAGNPSQQAITEACATAQVLITGWGVPFLAQLDHWERDNSPLRLVMHSAGTVKQLVPVDCITRGLQVSRANDSLAESVAEFTVGAIIMARRNAFAAANRYRHGQPLLAITSQRELKGSTVGIIGASAIGRRVMQLLQPFGVQILLADPYATPEIASAHGGAMLTDLDTALSQSDIVSLHAPVTEQTIGMLGAAQFAAMQDGALFVNTARARLIDSDALLSELQTGRISAVIDVTEPHEPLPVDSPFFQLENCVVLPHMAAVTRDARLRQSQIVVDEITRFLTSQPLHYAVDTQRWDVMA
jgi:phosphoglycerate dehydrogenase-like enzyme